VVKLLRDVLPNCVARAAKGRREGGRGGREEGEELCILRTLKADRWDEKQKKHTDERQNTSTPTPSPSLPFLPPSLLSSPWRDPPPTAFIRVRPDQIAHGAFMGHLEGGRKGGREGGEICQCIPFSAEVDEKGNQEGKKAHRQGIKGGREGRTYPLKAIQIARVVQGIDRRAEASYKQTK